MHQGGMMKPNTNKERFAVLRVAYCLYFLTANVPWLTRNSHHFLLLGAARPISSFEYPT
jgi:hypothetical protein